MDLCTLFFFFLLFDGYRRVYNFISFLLFFTSVVYSLLHTARITFVLPIHTLISVLQFFSFVCFVFFCFASFHISCSFLRISFISITSFQIALLHFRSADSLFKYNFFFHLSWNYAFQLNYRRHSNSFFSLLWTQNGNYSFQFFLSEFLKKRINWTKQQMINMPFFSIFVVAAVVKWVAV